MRLTTTLKSNIHTAYLLEWTCSLNFSKCVAVQWFCVGFLGSRWGFGAADEVGQRVRIGVDALLQEPVEQ